MARPHKILLTLSDLEFSRLNDLQTSFQKTSKKRISMSDILRRSLFLLPFQVSLFSFCFIHLPTGLPALAGNRPEVVSTGNSITRTESHFWDFCQNSPISTGGQL